MNNRISFKLTLSILSVISIIIFSSCIKDSEYKESGMNIVGTIISNNGLYKVIQIDNDPFYYYAEEINNNSNYNTGDRLILNTYSINYTQQPNYNNGTKSSPYLFTDVSYEKIPFSSFIHKSDDSELVLNDTILFFGLPYIVNSDLGYSILTLKGNTYTNSNTQYDLIFEESRNDTMVYTFKPVFNNAITTDKADFFRHSFSIIPTSSLQIVEVKFAAKNRDRYLTNYAQFSGDSIVYVTAPYIRE